MPLISSCDWLVIDLCTFRVKLGNIIADVQSQYSYIEKICEPYLSSQSPNCEIKIDHTSVVSVREITLQSKPKAEQIPEDTAEWFLEVYALLHKLLPLLPTHDMLFMHGSAICYKGKAYIFIAPSGTGKSTHTRLWKERFGDDVTVINDDKPFLVFREDKIYLCGTPWRGKHNLGENIEAELGAICILSRGMTDEIHLLKREDAVQDVIQQSNLLRYEHNALFALELIDKLLQSVPVYRLFCTPTLDAVNVCCKEIIK